MATTTAVRMMLSIISSLKGSSSRLDGVAFLEGV